MELTKNSRPKGGKRVRFISSFQNGSHTVLVKKGRIGRMFKRQGGSSVHEVWVKGIDHPIYPLRSQLVLA